MKSRKIKYSSALKTLIVILLIICVWVNLFSFYHLEASIRPDDYFIPKYLFPKKQSYVSKTKAWVPPKFDLDHPPPFSSLQVIHTVQTRFMVGQPNQPILARARFMLFETFCFPTMRYQTSQNFYWIVLVDPRLQEDILNDMQTLLKNMPNAFLVLTSNTTWAADGVGVPNVTSYGVDLQDIANEYRRRSEANHASNNGFAVISGDTSRLSDLDLFQPTTQNNSSNTGIIIKMDTILDADDGLHNLGVEWMQSMAVQYAQHQRQGMTTSRLDLASSWWVFCGTEHIEWHNREIYMLHPRDFEERGISSGITGVRKKPEFCTSAGFTRVGILEPPIQTVLYPRQAYLNHAQVIGKLLHCNITTLNHCYKREFPNIPLIVKSRSVTSDSMDHLNPQQANDYRDHTWHDSNHSPLWVNETENTWRVLEKEFGIDRFKAWKTSIYMHQHVLEIITENQAARCIPGFPCHESAKDNFVRLKNYFKKRKRYEKRKRLKEQAEQRKKEKA